MKRILSFFTNRLGVILFSIAVLCLYAVLQIDLGWFWNVCNVGNPKDANSLIETLSCSYIAAYVFYVLTIFLPNYVRKVKLTPIIRSRIHKIGTNDIRAILAQYSSGTGKGSNYWDLDNSVDILRSKNWDDLIPIFLKYEGVRISYFRFMFAKCIQMKERVSKTLDCYKDDITVDQLVALEEFVDLSFFSIVESLGNHSNTRVNDGRESIITDFIEMQRRYLDIERMFGINPCNNINEARSAD